MLDSSDIPTLLLDRWLKLRFLSRAATSFLAAAGDAEAPAGGTDYFGSNALLSDARRVLSRRVPISREIQTKAGSWHLWRLLPFPAGDRRASGVLITVIDVTPYHKAGDASEAARLRAERISLGKSRYLAAASHDLRQPLQTLSLLHGVMARRLSDPEALHQLILRGEETLAAMSGMLNALLDINQLEAGVLHPEVSDVSLGSILERMKSEFGYHTQSRGLGWRTVPCRARVRSDPRLLEQIVRNLLSNAVKYTKRGRILLGCRRRGDKLRIEIWDTGPGIRPQEQRAIFAEFHQMDNPAHDPGRGVGLGLAIVEHLAELLGHRIDMRSWEGKGSVFAIELALARAADAISPSGAIGETETRPGRLGSFLIVEDDLASRDAMELLLRSEGHRTIMAGDAEEALALAQAAEQRPDAIIVDYDLPGGLTGLELTAHLRASMHSDLPALVLTGDISIQASHEIAAQGCLQQSKPVASKPFSRLLQSLLAKSE